jgi:hypothetical protein
MIPPTRLDYCTSVFYPSPLTTHAPYGMVKGYMDAVYESPMLRNDLEDIYYIYHHKKGEWAIYMHGENKIGAKRNAKGLPKITLFLDSDITYDKLTDEGLPSGQKIAVTDVRQLNQVITDSLKDYPRNYFLPGANGARMSPSSYKQSLFRSTKKHLKQNLLREIYVFYFHKMRLVPPDTIETIAYYMRHSVSQAIESYTKVNVPPYTGRQIDIEIVKPTKVNIIEVERKPYFDPKAYGKKYREGYVNIGQADEKQNTDEKDKRTKKRTEAYTANKLKVLAHKNLWYLNKGLVKKPTQKTIDLYGLEKKDDVWISTKF